jgi:hypothetical protein
MKLKVRGYAYHKEKESIGDCNDRFKVNEHLNKFAISDGVTSSFLPDLWTEILTDQFVTTQGLIDVDNLFPLEQAQDTWDKKAKGFANIEGQVWYVKTFYEEERSAAATLTGLHLYYEDDCPFWEAMAIGDSFLFFVPELKVTSSNILSIPDAANFTFDNYPNYLDSINEKPKGNFEVMYKQALTEGSFYLMTDALAEWFTKNRATAPKQISTWQNQEAFVKQIKKLRKQKKLHNDDTSILIIEVTNNEKPEFVY